jgi:hypothetical protein
MQQKYFGDIHDFYKFFLLKKISENYSLGIHWCLISDDNTNDGEKKLTQKEYKLDGKLFEILTQQNRKLEDIEKYFPKMTKYFYELIDKFNSDGDYEDILIKQLSNVDFIFLDPDNGIEVNSTSNKNRYKYISYGLLSNLWKKGFSLIIYQHMDRSKYSIHNKLKKIISILKCKKEDIELLKIGNVFYIIIIQGKHMFFKDHLAMFTNSDINPGYILIENILEEKNG